jgi:hypothetical protein
MKKTFKQVGLVLLIGLAIAPSFGFNLNNTIVDIYKHFTKQNGSIAYAQFKPANTITTNTNPSFRSPRPVQTTYAVQKTTQRPKPAKEILEYDLRRGPAITYYHYGYSYRWKRSYGGSVIDEENGWVQISFTNSGNRFKGWIPKKDYEDEIDQLTSKKPEFPNG